MTDMDALKAIHTWSNPLLPPVFPVQRYPSEEQFPREHPNLNRATTEDMLEFLIEGLAPWQQDLARKAFSPGKLEVLVPTPRRHGRARSPLAAGTTQDGEPNLIESVPVPLSHNRSRT